MSRQKKRVDEAVSISAVVVTFTAGLVSAVREFMDAIPPEVSARPDMEPLLRRFRADLDRHYAVLMQEVNR